jgi:hypothetical protein
LKEKNLPLFEGTCRHREEPMTQLDRQLTPQDIAKIHRGQLSASEAPALYAALLETPESPAFFAHLHTHNEPLELTSQESQWIEASILAALQSSALPSSAPSTLASPASSSATSTPTDARHSPSPPMRASLALSGWLSSLRWLWTPVLAGAALLALFPTSPELSSHGWHEQRLSKPRAWLPPTQKNGATQNDLRHKGVRQQEAFLRIQIYRAQMSGQLDSKPSPFQQAMRLSPQDALVFRLLNLRRGHLYLVREDEQQRFEILYPFSKEKDQPHAAGEIALEQSGQAMAYQLEEAMLGKQRFWLLHSQRPQRLPTHRSHLSPAQKRLFQHADLASIEITPRRKAKD